MRVPSSTTSRRTRLVCADTCGCTRRSSRRARGCRRAASAQQHALRRDQPVLFHRRGERGAHDALPGRAFVRKRKSWPSLTAAIAASVSAWAREQDADGLGARSRTCFEQQHAVHDRHAQVAHDHGEGRALIHAPEPFLAAERGDDPYGPRMLRRTASRMLGSSSTNSTRWSATVILPGSRRSGRFPKPAAAACASGSRMMKVVPCGTTGSKCTVPPCLSCTMRYTMASPCPVPLPTALVVKKGSKTRCRASGAMPVPLSVMWISTSSPRGAWR